MRVQYVYMIMAIDFSSALGHAFGWLYIKGGNKYLVIGGSHGAAKGGGQTLILGTTTNGTIWWFSEVGMQEGLPILPVLYTKSS